MFITGGTRRVWPLRNVGAQADDYSLTADWDNQWLTGGLEADVIAEAHLDPDSVFAGVKRFADERAVASQGSSAPRSTRWSRRGSRARVECLTGAIGSVVEESRHLFVTPGVGTSILPVRFLVPPEIRCWC